MRPESLLGVALELIEELAARDAYPADARAGRFFRERRFLGSKDRRFVGDAAFAWLRHAPRARARRLAWARQGGPGGGEQSAERSAFLLDALILARDGLFPWSFEETLRAAALIPAAEGVLAIPDDAWATADVWPQDPVDRFAAEVSLPRWIAERLIRDRGEADARRLALAMLAAPPVDLRVSLRKTDRETARARLERESGLSVRLAPFSPVGLRLEKRLPIEGTGPFRDGWLEVEDEGSQLVALTLGAAPGMTVIDACAGAGGKTLALADRMFPGLDDRGSRLIACDVSSRKLEELARRARRAGLAGWVHAVAVPAEGPLPVELPRADIVLVDAPCSGLGTLRRSPDLKLRWTPDDVASFAAAQRALLERFAPLVKPGGRLAYATCSILGEENESVAGAFEAAHPELSPLALPAAPSLPPECLAGPRLRLDPAASGTDGFFLAMWHRAAG